MRGETAARGGPARGPQKLRGAVGGRNAARLTGIRASPSLRAPRSDAFLRGHASPARTAVSDPTLRRTILLSLCAAALLGGCKRDGGTISSEQFVRANVALRMVPDSGKAGAAARRAALRKAGVTPAQLRAFVAVNGDRRPSVLAKAWEAIDDSVQQRLSKAAAERPQGKPSVEHPPAPNIAGPGAMPPAKGPPAVPPPAPTNEAKLRVQQQGAPRTVVPLNNAPGAPHGLPPRSRVIPKAVPPAAPAPADSAKPR